MRFGLGRRTAPAQPNGRIPSKIEWVLEHWDFDRTAPHVVVIAGAETRQLDDAITRQLPGARVTHLSAALSEAELHIALAAGDAPRLIIDRSKKRATPSRLLRLMLHTERDGVLISHLGPARRATGPDRDAYRERVSAALDEHSSGLKFWPSFVAVRNARDARPTLREWQIDEAMWLNPDIGRVLATLPTRHVTSKIHLTMSEADHPQTFATEWATPDLSLREYRDAVSSPGMILESGRRVLPDTYRRVVQPNQRNHWTFPINSWFIDARYRTPPKAVPREDGVQKLSGVYFHLDNEFGFHFGHAMTEVTGKTWGWKLTKELYPDAKVLIHANVRAKPARWKVDMFAASGISEQDIVCQPRTVQVERLIAATPMFAHPGYSHPDLVDIWRTMGDRLAAHSSLNETPRRIFVSRTVPQRPCRNAEDVNDFFRALGFTVIYPEEHSIADQVRIFRNAEVIAGFAGSGLFGIMWAREPKQVIQVTSESYTARNEWLMAGLLGHQVDIAWCRSEATWNGTRWAPGSFQAPFSFDFAREGEFVRSAAAGLAR